MGEILLLLNMPSKTHALSIIQLFVLQLRDVNADGKHVSLFNSGVAPSKLLKCGCKLMVTKYSFGFIITENKKNVFHSTSLKLKRTTSLVHLFAASLAYKEDERDRLFKSDEDDPACYRFLLVIVLCR